MKKIFIYIIITLNLFLLSACSLTENGSNNQEYTALKEDYDDLLENYNKMQDDYATMQDDYSEIDQNLSSLNDEYAILDAKNRALKNEYNTLETENNNLQTNIDQLNNDNTLLNNQINDLESENTALETENSNLQTNIDQLNNDNTLLNNQIDILESENSHLEETNNTLQQANNDLTQNNNTLQTEKDNLADALLASQIALDDYNDLVNKVTSQAMKANVMIYTHTYRVVLGNKYTVSSGQGSGVIFKFDGTYYYALTNNHVIYGDPNYNTEYFVYDYLHNEYSATLIASSADYDLGVVKFKASNLTTLGFSENNPIPENMVIALGQPFGQINALTLGNVIGYGKVTLSGDPLLSNVKFDVIKHDAPLNNGSSGGVLINEDLEIVGINYAVAKDSDGNVLICYSIPVTKVIEFLNLKAITY